MLCGGVDLDRGTNDYSTTTSQPRHCPETHKLPWDVIAHIVKCAGLAALKVLSLVCHDLLEESAPTLCRSITISFGHNLPWAWEAGPLDIQTQTEVLNNHSRRKFIRHINLRFYPSRHNTASDPAAKDHFVKLFSTIQLLEQLEIFEIDSDEQHDLEGAFHSAKLPSTLSQLHIRQGFTRLCDFKGSFWRRHAPHLTSLTLMVSGFSAWGRPLDGYPVLFPLLARLHAYDYNTLICAKVQENTLKHLIIDRVGPRDVFALHGALTAEPSPRTRPPTTMPLIAMLEQFEFGYVGRDPQEMYRDVIVDMHQLQKLTAKHTKFPNAFTASETAQALLKLEHLQLFEWFTTSSEPGVYRWSGNARLTETEGIVGWNSDIDSESEESDGRDEDEREWMAFARLVTECRSLRRLTYCRRDRSSADIVETVITRQGYDDEWKCLTTQGS